MLGEEVGHREADILRDQRAPILHHVAAIGQRRDRRRICRGTADAVLFQHLHERGFGEPGRRLGEMLRGVEAQELELLALGDVRKRIDLRLGLVRAFGIDAEESVEQDLPAVRAEGVVLGGDIEARVLEAGRGHLRSERPLPDHGVEPQLVLVQIPPHLVRGTGQVRRTDRLVSLLRAFALRLEMARLVQRVPLAELRADHVLRLLERAFGDVKRVGPHVGDEPDRAVAERNTLVELLREHHRPLHRVPELPRGLLLQGGCGEWGCGVAAGFALFQARDPIHRIGERGAMAVRVVAAPDLELLALVLDERRIERLAEVIRQQRVDRPVLDRGERTDRALPVDDESQRDRLDAAGRQSVPDLLPQERRHRVAHEPIDHPTGLLRIHQIAVDLPRMLEGLGDRRRGDLMEGHAAQLRRGNPDDLRDVPGDRLALAVKVAREPDPVGRLRVLAELPDVLLRVRRDDVVRSERLKIDAQLRLRQVPDVAVGGLDGVARTEHPGERAGLRRALDDDQIAAHGAHRTVVVFGRSRPRSRRPAGPLGRCRLFRRFPDPSGLRRGRLRDRSGFRRYRRLLVCYRHLVVIPFRTKGAPPGAPLPYHVTSARNRPPGRPARPAPKGARRGPRAAAGRPPV